EGSRAWTRPLALRPLLQESDGPRPRVGAGSPKYLRVGKAKRARVGKNHHRRRDAKSAYADRLVTHHHKFISSHGALAQGERWHQRFWLRSIRAGNRFSCCFRLQRRQLNGNPDVFVSQTGRKYRKATCPLRLVAL